MQPSPGEQPRHKPPQVRRIALALLVAFVIATFMFAFRENIREYRLFLTEERPAVQFTFDELSETWTEGDLRARFAGMEITCDASFDRHLDDRACFIDISEHNHVPAMFVAFFFAAGKLNHAAVNIPWWSHDLGYKSLALTYGKPNATQAQAYAGVRLHGWKLKNGSAVFYNRDRPVNPLDWNAVLWNSASSCASGSCFAGR